jgi:hypothetical protein
MVRCPFCWLRVSGVVDWLIKLYSYRILPFLSGLRQHPEISTCQVLCTLSSYFSLASDLSIVSGVVL